MGKPENKVWETHCKAVVWETLPKCKQNREVQSKHTVRDANIETLAGVWMGIRRKEYSGQWSAPTENGGFAASVIISPEDIGDSPVNEKGKKLSLFLDEKLALWLSKALLNVENLKKKKKNVDKLGFSSFQLKISFSIPPKRKGEGGRERNLYFSTEIFDNKWIFVVLLNFSIRWSLPTRPGN